MKLEKFTLSCEVIQLLSTVAAEERGIAYAAVLDYIFFEKEIAALSNATAAIVAQAVEMIQKRVNSARRAQIRRENRDPNAPRKPTRAQILAQENLELRRQVDLMGQRISALERLIRDMPPSARHILAQSGVFRRKPAHR